MAANHIAYTAPINPPSATPILTTSQVWAGLEIKIRHAEDFVPVIESIDVLEETHEGNIPVTVREIIFKEGERPNSRVRETCKAYEPMKVDFHMDNGSVVSNVISEGSGGAEKGDLVCIEISWSREVAMQRTPITYPPTRIRNNG